ncbi:MAG: cobalamin B12-binding domain-containing protein [Acidimicrobiales bacterium]
MPLSLYEAAEELGVHYQTAYRWVRRGLLPAVKVNGSYKVEVEAVAELQRGRAAPAPPPARRRVRSWTPFADRAYCALAVGDETRVRELIADLVEGGVSLAEVCDHVLAPSMAAVGERWAVGALTIAEEHRASAICGRAIARWAPTPPGRPRGVAVVCSPTEEGHELPGLMATAVLRERHWRVHHLGVGVPANAVERLVAGEDAQLVVVSVAWPPAMPEAARLAGGLAGPGRHVLVGRPGATMTELVAGVGAVA